MIKIKLHQGQFMVVVSEEEWEFPTRKELDIVLKTLLDYKEKYGKIKMNIISLDNKQYWTKK